jgi:hypothetical protein
LADLYLLEEAVSEKFRDKHHKEYKINPELREQRLEEIRVNIPIKYQIEVKSRKRLLLYR